MFKSTSSKRALTGSTAKRAKISEMKPLEHDIITKGASSYFRNTQGQFYTLGQTNHKEPVLVQLDNNKSIVKIIPGYCHTFYIDEDGDCFVSGTNVSGEAGVDNSPLEISKPLAVTLPNGKPIKDVVAGQYMSFFKDSDGLWHGCGTNLSGQLGISSRLEFISSPKPITIPGNSPIIKIVASHHHSFFQDAEGLWYGSGSNINGQLARKDTSKNRRVPVPITLPNHIPIKEIMVGKEFTLISDTAGNWYGCGDNDFSQLGLLKSKKYNENITEPTLIKLPNNKPIVRAICGRYSTFFCDIDGDWHACGANSFGQLGLGTNDVPIYPQKLSLASGVAIKDIVIGEHHTFFLDANHAWHGCGSNSKKQLGLKTRSDQLTLIEIDFSQFEPTPHLSKEDKRGPLKYDTRRKDFYYGQSLDQLFARKNKGSQAPAEPPEPDDEIINSDGEEEGRIYRVGK